MGDPDIIILSSDDESKPSVKVTSPKLSLKRNRTELTPDRKSDEGSASRLSSEKVSKRIKFGEPESVSVELSIKKTEVISTDSTPSVSAHIPSSTNVASPVQVIELSDEPVVIEDRVTSPKLSLKRKRMELTPNRKCDEESAKRLSSERVSKKIKFDEPDVALNESNEKTEVSLNTYILQQYDAIPYVSAYMSSSTRVASPVQVIELTDEPVVIEDRESSRDDSIVVSCWNSDVPKNSNKKKNTLEERKEKFMELLDFSEKHDPSTSKEEKLKIRKNMLKSFNNTQQSYVESENFNLLLDISFKKIKRKDRDNLVILGEIRDELKKHKKKDKKKSFKGSVEDITIFSAEDSISKDNCVDSTSSLPAKITKGDSTFLHTNLNFSSRFNEYCQISERQQSADSASCSSLTSESAKTVTCKENSISKSDNFHTVADSGKKLLTNITNEFNSSVIALTVEEHSLESNTSNLSHLKNQTEEKSAEVATSSGIHLSAKAIPEHVASVNADVNKKFDLSPLALTSEVTSEKDMSGNDDVNKKFNLSSLQNNKSNSMDNSDSDLQTATNLNNKLISDNSATNEFSSSDIASAVGLKRVEVNISKMSEHIVPENDDLNKKIDSYSFPSTSQCPSPSTKYSFKNDNLSLKSRSSSADSSSTDRRTQIEKNEDDRNARRIKKLEKRLKELDKAIKKCQGKDLSLDDLDDEDSTYIKESKYKKQFLAVYKLLCKFKSVPARTGRIIEKKFHYEGSRYRLINEAIEKLINKKKASEKFPDYSEVLNVIKQVDERHDLGFNEVDISNEAKRVFEDIGEALKERRWRDERELLGCYLTDDVNLENDPAEQDEHLKKTLEENSKKFHESINQVIDHYVQKQQEAPAEDNVADDDDEEEEDIEEDEKEEDEEETIANTHDDSDDLPGTAPASPTQNDGAPIINIVDRDNDDDDIEIINYSDRSTDQEEEVKRRKNSTTNKPNISESVVLEDSEGSGDLPSIQDLIGR